MQKRMLFGGYAVMHHHIKTKQSVWRSTFSTRVSKLLCKNCK